MKLFSLEALKDAQALAKIATDDFDMAMANVLLAIAYGYHKFNQDSEDSMRLADKYYGKG